LERRQLRVGGRSSINRDEIALPIRLRLDNGRLGFVASWRPVYQNRSAIKVGGSPFKTLAEAEKACMTMLVHLIRNSDSGATPPV
jgi:hypothetical protein